MSRATIEILLAEAASAVEVAFTLPGGTGAVPDGGAQFALLQKQSTADGDFDWTNTPQVQALQFDTALQPPTLSEGQSRWNPITRTIETELGGPVLEHGFDTLVRAANFTGVEISRGKLVAFVGADLVNSVPRITPMIADGSILPAHVLGLTAENIPDTGTIGRVTAHGDVHGLDTTGAAEGETWAAGDVLYASPLTPGALTNVEPTPPAVTIPIALVVKADATDGTLLVRPTLFPRLQYGVFSDDADQTHDNTETPKEIILGVTEISSGVSVDPLNPSRVVVEKAGLYEFQASLQIAKTSSVVGLAWLWPRVNGVDVPRSSSKVSISGNSTTRVPSRNFVLLLDAEDYFELLWAVDSTTIYLNAEAAETFAPSVPSVILTVAKINQ